MSLISIKDALAAPLLERIPESITPNHLTTMRLLLSIPLFFFLLYGYMLYGLITFILAFALDILDGSLARKRKQSSALGKMLDPLADKVVFLIAFFILGASIEYNLYIIIITLEVVTVLGSVLLPSIALLFFHRDLDISTNRAGQYKMLFYACGVIFLFITAWIPSIYGISIAALWCGAILSLISMLSALVSIRLTPIQE